MQHNHLETDKEASADKQVAADSADRDVAPTRESIPLAAFRAAQAELGLALDDAVKIKDINDQFSAAVLQLIEDSKLGDMSKEERARQLEQIQALEKTFVPKLKELMTADQFQRLQQIYWQDLGTTARIRARSD